MNETEGMRPQGGEEYLYMDGTIKKFASSLAKQPGRVNGRALAKPGKKQGKSQKQQHRT